MKKSDMLPVIAAVIIALLVIPIGAVNAATPNTSYSLGSVVTIPEDDLKRETGVMVLGLDPVTYENTLYGNVVQGGKSPWYSESTCTIPVSPDPTIVGPEVTSEPVMGYTTYYQKVEGGTCVAHKFMPRWPTATKGYAEGMDLLSQHKVLATLNGVPTKPDYLFCEVIEKEKAKIPPMTTKTASKRQFDDEIIKSTVKDVSSNFICKFTWVKPGVGVLDVYFVGPRTRYFIADHMLIVTLGWKVGRTTVWATDLQDICILGWSMGENTLKIRLFENPGKSTWSLPGGYEYYWSWNDAINEFVSCDEAAVWQLAWIVGGWPYTTN